jgi:sec-independent protein translocase protein TatC
LSFQTSQADSINITLQAKMNEYLSLMMTFIFAFGLAFQLPVVLLLLGKSWCFNYSAISFF